MNIKEIKKIQEAFKQIFESEVSEKFYARILMYKFLGEVEKITEERGISRKELAKKLGTSASYITQLYQGNKIINLDLLGKLEQALEIEFNITASPVISKAANTPATPNNIQVDIPAKKPKKAVHGIIAQ